MRIKVFASFLVLFLQIISSLATAGLMLPSQLNSQERESILRLVGFGSSTKFLSDPFPLGGYYGFEAGMTVETVGTQEISRMGSHLESTQSDITIPKITVAKGLYNNVDMTLQFTPYSQRTELSQYGASVRWTFFQGVSSPFALGFHAHFNSANINNQVAMRTYGLDLLGGFYSAGLSVFAGVGSIQSAGSFIGGTSGVTESQRLEMASVSSLHSFAGVAFRLNSVRLDLKESRESYSWEPYAVVQLDRYSQNVISAKLGLRF